MHSDTRRFPRATAARHQILLILSLVCGLDWLTKLWAYYSVALTQRAINFCGIVFVHSPNYALGVLGWLGGNRAVYWLGALSLFVIVTGGLVFVQTYYGRNRLFVIGYSLLIGGFIANALQAAVFGCVTDFVRLSGWGFFHGLIYNCADVAMLSGGLLFLGSLLWNGLRHQTNVLRQSL